LLVSIILPVYNEEVSIKDTLDSLVIDKNVEYEIIVVNDGSTDNSLEIVKSLSNQNDRIKILNQENGGITQALINGCNAATGQYIARQDAGDLSLPGRFSKQVDILNANPNAVLCSTGTRYVSDSDEHLYDVLQQFDEANNGLRPQTLDGLCGPSHHGATMFRRDAYLKVGGYRKEFVVGFVSGSIKTKRDKHAKAQATGNIAPCHL